VTRYSSVTTSAGGEAASGKEKGGDNVSWADANLTGLKMKKIHAVVLVATNG
jgi:hypothetical protein